MNSNESWGIAMSGCTEDDEMLVDSTCSSSAALDWIAEQADGIERSGYKEGAMAVGLAVTASMAWWLPFVAAPVPVVVKKLAQLHQKRATEQAEELKEELLRRDRERVEAFFASEDGQDLLLHVFRETVKTASRKKRRWYAKALGGAAEERAAPEVVEEILQSLDLLTESDLGFLLEFLQHLQEHRQDASVWYFENVGRVPTSMAELHKASGNGGRAKKNTSMTRIISAQAQEKALQKFAEQRGRALSHIISRLVRSGLARELAGEARNSSGLAYVPTAALFTLLNWVRGGRDWHSWGLGDRPEREYPVRYELIIDGRHIEYAVKAPSLGDALSRQLRDFKKGGGDPKAFPKSVSLIAEMMDGERIDVSDRIGFSGENNEIISIKDNPIDRTAPKA